MRGVVEVRVVGGAVGVRVVQERRICWFRKMNRVLEQIFLDFGTSSGFVGVLLEHRFRCFNVSTYTGSQKDNSIYSSLATTNTIHDVLKSINDIQSFLAHRFF